MDKKIINPLLDTKNKNMNLINPFVLKKGIPTDGLVLYLPFNGNSNDESGNGYHATNYGATLTTNRKGESNKAYSFDGSNDYMTLVKTPMNGLQKYTISLWFNINAFSDYASFFGSRDGNYNVLYFGLYSLSLVSDLSGVISNGTSLLQLNKHITNNPPQLQTSTWYHGVMYHDGSGTNKLYIKLNNNYLYSSVTGLSGNLVLNDLIKIGTDDNLSGRYFNGKIDDIRVYNRILTSDEITALYNE